MQVNSDKFFVDSEKSSSVPAEGSVITKSSKANKSKWIVNDNRGNDNDHTNHSPVTNTVNEKNNDMKKYLRQTIFSPTFLNLSGKMEQEK